MRALAVDFRTSSGPPRWAWSAVAVLLSVAAGLLGWGFSIQQRIRADESELTRVRAEQTALPSAPQAVIRSKMPYDASAREFLALATAEWPGMLVAIESVEIAGVVPVAIDVMPTEHLVRLELEFRDYRDVLRYVETLNAGEDPVRWALVQAQVSAQSTASAGASSVASIRGRWVAHW